MTSQTLIRLKLFAALVALACGIGAFVTVYLLYQATPAATTTPPASPAAAAAPSTPSAVSVSAPRFPTPPAGALVLGAEARDLAVGLAASRRESRLALQISVLGPDQPASGLSVSVGSATARACGPGCYAADVGLDARRVAVTIRGGTRPTSKVSFVLPASLDRASAKAFVEKAATTWRSLKTLVNHDRLSSGPGATIHTLWRFQAPNRYAYEIRHGPRAVSIGPRRWDRLPGHRWQESEQDPILQPLPLWQSVSNAHFLGTSTVRGRPVVRASFYDPKIHAWFTIAVDRQTMHTLDLRMTATAHFMHEIYGPFDAPFDIVPPAKASR